MDELKAEYCQICSDFDLLTSGKQKVSLAEARANRLKIDWTNEPPVVPAMKGIYQLKDYPLDEIRKYISWTPFFNLWQLKGKYPQIFDHKEYGAEARNLFDNANKLLDTIIERKLITANGVLGIFPANSVGDDIEVYASTSSETVDETRLKTLCKFFNLRNQDSKIQNEHPNLSLSDFIAPRESGLIDYIGAFAVTAGIGVEKLANEYDDYEAIMVKALADRLAEAFAELLFVEVRRKYWVFNEKNGIRMSHGYPACPDHSEKGTLFDLLGARNLGMNLTETFAMTPAASVSGLIFAHPQSRYFSVGKITEEQEKDYAQRKGIE